MTLPARFPVCPVCHGVHKAIPECGGRPQTDWEWMVDRGVRPVEASAIVTSRHRAALGSLVLAPDPNVAHVAPFGAPEPVPRTAYPVRPPDPEPETLF